MDQTTPRLDKVGLTYANELFEDDIGSQLHRIYGIYALARHLKVAYIHSPLRKVNDQRVDALKGIQSDFDFVELANKIFQIPSDIVLPSGGRVHTTMETTLGFLSAVRSQAAYDEHFHLIRLGNPLSIINHKPELWNFVEEVFPFNKVRNNAFLKIGIHVNGADFFATKPEQVLPNDYFVQVAMRVTRVLKKHQLPFICELFSDIPSESMRRLFPADPRFLKMRPEMFSLHDFEQVPCLKKVINSNPMAVLKSLASSDILIMNPSSLSYVGGLLNQTGVVIAPPSTPSKLSRWMNCDQDLEAKIEDCSQTWKRTREFVPSRFFSPPFVNTTSRLKNLALTYDNASLMDGAGSQLCRIYGIYAFARQLNVSYYHSPLQRIGYQGVISLEKNEEDLKLPKKYNEKFHIPSDVEVPPDAKVTTLVFADKRSLSYLKEKAQERPGQFFLVKISSASAMVGNTPLAWESARSLSPFKTGSKKQVSPLFRIAIHVRWGDLPIGYSKRLLPNQYYIDVAKKIMEVLKRFNIPYVCELYAELPSQPFTVTPDHYGIEGRLEAPMVLDPESYHLADFETLPHLKKFINGDPIETLERLATTDVLVMSRSAFSYLGALFNETGAAVYYPFEYPPMPGWLQLNPLALFEEQLEEYCKKWKSDA
ncbi:MAG: hypothetical protein WCO92_00455 [Verrucomicrobiota bacterium]